MSDNRLSVGDVWCGCAVVDAVVAVAVDNLSSLIARCIKQAMYICSSIYIQDLPLFSQVRLWGQLYLKEKKELPFLLSMCC